MPLNSKYALSWQKEKMDHMAGKYMGYIFEGCIMEVVVRVFFVLQEVKRD